MKQLLKVTCDDIMTKVSLDPLSLEILTAEIVYVLSIIEHCLFRHDVLTVKKCLQQANKKQIDELLALKRETFMLN